MELSSTFTCQDWTIRYRLVEADESSDSKPEQTTTVVFVHGTPWSSDVFQPMAKALLATGRYNVLLYDLPGYGQSQDVKSSSSTTSEATRFVGDTSVKAQAAILADLLKHLRLDGKDGNRAPAVVAHDIAGTIALRTHLIHQCEFASLLLMDTNCVLPWGDGFYKLARSEPDVFLKLPLDIYEAVVRAVIKSACFNPRRLLSGWEDALSRPWIGSNEDTDAKAEEKRRSFIRQIAQANDADVAEMLDADMYANVRCDVKILWGENDGWIPREKMESLISKIGNRMKQFIAISEAGHLIMIDQPERVTLEVQDWLSKNHQMVRH